MIEAPDSREIQRQLTELLRRQTRDFHFQRLSPTGMTGLYFNDKDGESLEGRAAEFIAGQLVLIFIQFFLGMFMLTNFLSLYHFLLGPAVSFGFPRRAAGDWWVYR